MLQKKSIKKRRTSFKSKAPLLCFHSSNECYLFFLGTIVIVCPFLQTPVGIALQLKEFFILFFILEGWGMAPFYRGFVRISTEELWVRMSAQRTWAACPQKKYLFSQGDTD